MRLLLAVLLVATVIVGACGGTTAPSQPNQPELTAGETGTRILQAMRDRDMETLASYVDPDRGVRLTAYPYVNTKSDLVLTRDELKGALDDSTVRTWGTFDGSGEHIKMSFAEYFDRFVYDHDYLNAEKVGVNEFIGQGNATNNAREVYPDATIIEYHFSGFDPKYNGMDWRSLRLVLEETDGRWYLIGIIHAEWTI